MRFWRRREGAETTEAEFEERESFSPGEDAPVEAPQWEQVPEVVETEERRGWLSRLKAGMARSSTRLTQGINTIFNRRRLDDEDDKGLLRQIETQRLHDRLDEPDHLIGQRGADLFRRYLLVEPGPAQRLGNLTRDTDPHVA